MKKRIGHKEDFLIAMGKNMAGKEYGQEKNMDRKRIWTGKEYGRKRIWQEKNMDRKRIWTGKEYGQEKNMDREKIRTWEKIWTWF